MADVGDLVPSTTGGRVTVAPTHCPNGRPLGGNQVLVGHVACRDHRGHTTWTCRACDGTVYAPQLDGCELFNRAG